MAKPEHRRDGTQIRIQILMEVCFKKQAPLYTKDGIYFKICTHPSTLKRAVADLEMSGIIKSIDIPREDGSTVKGIEITLQGEKMAKEGLSVLHTLA